MRVWMALLALVATAGCFDGFGRDRGPSPYDFVAGGGTWVIEVDHVTNFAPSSSATSALHARMMALVAKDDIQIRTGGTVKAGDGTWSIDEIQAAHKASRNVKAERGIVTTHVLYLDGRFQENDVLGVAIGHGLVAIFQQRIREACTPTNLCFFNEAEIEKAVLIHEFGHVIGLVNRGIPMVNAHEDPEHTGHSSNDQSVMFWRVESPIGLLGLSRIPTEFDSNDKRDVCEAGGKCA